MDGTIIMRSSLPPLSFVTSVVGTLLVWGTLLELYLMRQLKRQQRRRAKCTKVLVVGSDSSADMVGCTTYDLTSAAPPNKNDLPIGIVIPRSMNNNDSDENLAGNSSNGSGGVGGSSGSSATDTTSTTITTNLSNGGGGGAGVLDTSNTSTASTVQSIVDDHHLHLHHHHHHHHVVAEERHFGICTELLLSFSVITNFRAICDRTVGSDSISCIHGLRAISMAWVILGHTCIITFKYSDNMELRKLVEKQFLFQTVTNGAYSVDTFFFMSGFLVSYIYFRTNAKGKLEKLSQGVGEVTAGTFHFFGLLVYRFIRCVWMDACGMETSFSDSR